MLRNKPKILKNCIFKTSNKIILNKYSDNRVEGCEFNGLKNEININNLIRGNVIENVVDLFSLSYCKFLIKSDQSTWSEFAEYYRKPPSVSVNDDWESVIKPKYINPNWVQPDGYYFGHENLDYQTLLNLIPDNLKNGL